MTSLGLIPLHRAAGHPAVDITYDALRKRVWRGALPPALAQALEKRGGRWYFVKSKLDHLQAGEVWL
ncbi:MAG: hypothetical protein AMXMBFR31_23500 [Candidatus Desulfobacillus denitrificans]|jgi:hypothetical protein|nr:hypothetical protein [Anaerolineae bacterium]